MINVGGNKINPLEIEEVINSYPKIINSKVTTKKNSVIVGNKDSLAIKKIYLRNLNLLDNLESAEKDLFIKVRSTGRLIKAKINLSKDCAEVSLRENEIGISPGQACVFYSKNNIGDKVLGGGWIIRTESNYLST